MIAIQGTLFSLLLNLLLQITFFAIMAGAFSRLVAKVTAKHRHFFYLAVLLFSLAAPVVNTLWRPSSPASVERSGQSTRVAATAGHLLPSWQSDATQHRTLTFMPALQGWIGSMWAVFVLLQLARYILAVCRIQRLRKEAFDLLPAQASVARQVVASKSNVKVLQSKAIDDPVTIGVFRSVILLPTKVLPDLCQDEVSAVVAHEYSHIRRKDFPIHMMCEFLSLPVAWHPGIAYLTSKISQTRELACDEYAATYLGNRHSYANTLLRLASLCLHVPRLSAAGLGFLDGDDLEARITTLTGKTRSLTRAGVAGIVLATSITFGVGAVAAYGMSLQASTEPTKAADKFVGTWHWMFEGRSFVTMVLVQDHGRLTGTITGSRIALNEEGGLSRADPSEDLTPNPIAKVTSEGSALHITVKDEDEPFEFVMKLKNATHAEIHPDKAPTNMKAIQVEKVF